MKKTMTMLMFFLVLSLAGCGNKYEPMTDGTDEMGEATETAEGKEKAETEESKKEKAANTDYLNNPPRIEDIDWFVEEGMINGNSAVVFGYINNTNYIILDVEMEFVQKEGTTPEDLSVFDSLKEDSDSWTDEEIAEIYILGYNRKVADPGERVDGSYCCINGTYTDVQNIEQYNIMEPSEVSIAYAAAGDDKVYATVYDFKDKTYSSMGVEDIYEWSDENYGKMLDKPDFISVNIDTDDDKRYAFTCFGVEQEGFEAYKQNCIGKGFTDAEYDDDTSYDAVNSDGFELWMRYDPVEEELQCRIVAPEPSVSEEETIETETEAEAAIETEESNEVKTAALDDDSIRPEFKETMDKYEEFFDEYAEFMTRFQNAENTVSMLADYTEYLTKYTEVMDSISKLGDEEMSNAEALYYAEVMLRIEQTMLEVSSEMQEADPDVKVIGKYSFDIPGDWSLEDGTNYDSVYLAPSSTDEIIVDSMVDDEDPVSMDSLHHFNDDMIAMIVDEYTNDIFSDCSVDSYSDYKSDHDVEGVLYSYKCKFNSESGETADMAGRLFCFPSEEDSRWFYFYFVGLDGEDNRYLDEYMDVLKSIRKN